MKRQAMAGEAYARKVRCAYTRPQSIQLSQGRRFTPTIFRSAHVSVWQLLNHFLHLATDEEWSSFFLVNRVENQKLNRLSFLFSSRPSADKVTD